MRYRSVFSITYSAASDAAARQTAFQHLEQVQDMLLVEGADHPYNIRLDRIFETERDVLADAVDAPLNDEPAAQRQAVR